MRKSTDYTLLPILSPSNSLKSLKSRYLEHPDVNNRTKQND